MPAVQCPSCESDDIDAVGKSPAGDLMLRCDACGGEWTRTPNRPCPSCGAIDVTHTDSAGYLCRGCDHRWRDIPVVATQIAPAKAVRSRTTRPAATRPVSGGSAHRIDAVWDELGAHAGEPFTLKSGQEFTYHVSGAVLMPTTANWDVPKSEFAEALRRMPVSGPAALKDLQAAAFIYALLHDPRIGKALA